METAAEARRRLQREVEAFTQAILDNKHKINGLSLTARLPFELLVQVFHFYAFPTEDTRIGRSTGNSLIFNITQICHHWREVALASPQLWCRIAVCSRDSLPYLDAIFSRSKDLPLDVLLTTKDYYDTMPAEVSRYILSHINRISMLHFAARGCGGIIRQLIPQDIPLLRQLAIKDGAFLDISDLAKLETCSMPSLMKLSLFDCPVSGSSSLFRPTLTHLHLAYLSSRSEQTHQGVLSALEHLNCLQYLGLERVLYTRPPDEQPSHRTVTLPDLRKITINDAPIAVGWFLRRLIFPTSACMSIQTNVHPLLESLFVEVAGKLTGAHAIGSPLCLLSAALYSPTSSDLVFECFTTPRINGRSLDPMDPLREPALMIKLTLDGGELDKSLPGTILRAFPLSTLTTLHFTPNETSATVDVWYSYFSSLTNLRVLRVGPWGEDTLPLALACNMAAAGYTDSLQAPLFPRLQKLILNEVDLYGKDFEDDEEEDEDDSISDGDDTPVDKYVRALMVRRASGAPLRKLVINECYSVRQRDVDDLSKLVTVRWDGKSLVLGDETEEEDSAEDEYEHEYSEEEDEDEDEDEDTEDEDSEDIDEEEAFFDRNLTLEDLFEDGDYELFGW